jgi:hypothetical protein
LLETDVSASQCVAVLLSLQAVRVNAGTDRLIMLHRVTRLKYSFITHVSTVEVFKM